MGDFKGNLSPFQHIDYSSGEVGKIFVRHILRTSANLC